LVWDPKGDGKQTIRTGFALIHDSMELFYPERWTTNPPYASSITLTNPTAPLSNPWLGYPGGNPFPGAAIFPVGGTYVTIPPDVADTYMMQWNVSYQRQFGSDWLATINYLGNRTNHILGAHEINPAVVIPGATSSNTASRRFLTLLNPTQGAQYSSIVQTDDGNNASYNGLLLSLNHRFSNHFTALVNYTWSHCISTYDFGGELAGNNYQNPNNRAAERGSCNFDRRHIFNTSLVAQSPALGNAFVKKLTGGWQVAPIISAYTGQPMTPTDGGTDVSLTAVGADRPDVVIAGSIYQHTQASWFTQTAFKQQAPGTYGNAGRDSVFVPGSFNFDVALSREFTMRERYRLQVRGDFFNILNHPNWGAPAMSITSGTFGQITSFSSPRIIQMAMKFFF
jgi:hypothetical protein